ncbi:sulfatase family protein [Pontiella sulfatireligans]|uniref:Arylsulfatase n=1 Tax=Pontiella sulfatireligans TaxID=2750658 RepID=A0A6C2UE93_9BACT|nr:sulfatase [Pontiella sulfatireligans]SPS74142.1 sulfatase S1_27 [Kiritimatiellales bacterium]VGO18183.1 Arylsulfatase [Pontiella sulfatireligans]
MNRRSFSKSITVGSAFLAGCSTTVSQEKQPNLLYVFPDQMRMHAMGFWKKPEFNKLLRTETDPVHTPNIDRLAENSVVFTQATSTHPVCSPHRAMLMSGMYPSRNGIEDVNCHAGRPQGLLYNVEYFTDVLATAGYETAYVGKTHWQRTEPFFDKEFNYVGTSEPPGGEYANAYDTYIPPGRGRLSNKYWFQLFKDDHFSSLGYSNRPELVNGKKDGQPYKPGRFTPEVEADAIVDYLENKNGERDASKPFSLIWSPNPPHNPYFSPDDCEKDIYDTYYRDMPLDEQMYRKNVKPQLASENKLYDPVKCTAVYYSLVTGVDRQLGRVLQALEKTGEADNTIVVFTADHGEMMGSHGVTGKNYYEDESFLVPFLICYPEKIKPHADNLLMGSVDIMPSVLGMLGMKDRIPETVEGTDYSQGIITGDYASCPKPKSALYLNMKRKGVRTNRYTYCVHNGGRAEVVDNVKDPYQLNKQEPSAIPVADLEMLKKELGMRLELAGDGWAKDRKFPEWITYPS